MKHVTAKLGNMRKAVEWIVYPATDGDEGLLKIQSDSRICRFDPKTGKGLLSRHCASGAYGVHLSPKLGATFIDVPADVIAATLEARPKVGDKIGGGVFLG